jgi:hypothetical protein
MSAQTTYGTAATHTQGDNGLIPAVGNNDSWAYAMAGLVPAIGLGNLPPLMAGTVAGT